MVGPALVTKDMVPRQWLMTPQQEHEWLLCVASRLPGSDPDAMRRLVAIELPDIKPAWQYQETYQQAAGQRDDLVTPIVTSWEQWRGREDVLCEIVKHLWEGTAPAVVFVAVAVPRD